MKLQDECFKCYCQTIITFTPHQFKLEGGPMKNKQQKYLKGTKKAWDSFIKPGSKMATALISAAVAAETMNPQSAQVTKSILKSLTEGKILSLTDMHGRGFRLKVM